MREHRNLNDKADLLARYFECVSQRVWSPSDPLIESLYNIQNNAYRVRKAEGDTKAHEASLQAVIRHVLLSD